MRAYICAVAICRSQNHAVRCTVNTAYSAIGYSAKSDIVPILGWYGIPYTNNYRI